MSIVDNRKITTIQIKPDTDAETASNSDTNAGICNVPQVNSANYYNNQVSATEYNRVFCYFVQRHFVFIF